MAVILYGHRKLKEGMQIGDAERGAKEDIERVREAEAKGDDDSVLESWREHQK
mgnify:CR=1 FL=1